ncbi:MAG: hypothetical protein FJ253_09750 [Phycisphaerae bacterium]|nr:hypothetical protein [Phycisphaerae bacterium]
MRRQHQFKFKPTVVFADVEKILQISLFAVSGIYGHAAVRLHVSYERDAESRAITIDTSSAIGEDVARSFTELLTREVGEAGFVVSMIDDGGDDPDWPLEEASVP